MRSAPASRMRSAARSSASSQPIRSKPGSPARRSIGCGMRPRRRSSSPRMRSSAETSASTDGVERAHRVQAQQAQADVAEMDAVERPVVKALGPERAPVANAVGEDPHRVGRLVAVLPRRAEDLGEVVRALLADPERLERRPVRGRGPLHRLAQSVALRHRSIFASVARTLPTRGASPGSSATASRTSSRSRSRSRSAWTAQPLAITMRTPGNDEELGTGLPLRRGPDRRSARRGAHRRPRRQRGRGGGPAPSRSRRAELLHDLVVRRLRQGRDRAGRGALGALWPRGPRSSATSSPSCPTACASPGSTAPAASTPPGSSTSGARWRACARTSAATTPWTR